MPLLGFLSASLVVTGLAGLFFGWRGAACGAAGSLLWGLISLMVYVQAIRSRG